MSMYVYAQFNVVSYSTYIVPVQTLTKAVNQYSAHILTYTTALLKSLSP